MHETLENKVLTLELPGGRRLDFSRHLVMGAINITPDSFSDGGRFFKPEATIGRTRQMIDEGADIIDFGGESSHPGSEPITLDEELNRVIPVIKAVREFSGIPISIDTTKAEVARGAIEAGADIINDISALRFDDRMVNVARDFDAPIIIMHMLGTPRTMQDNPSYADCVNQLKDFFDERIDFCMKNGIKKDRIILDPGIGFGKRLQDNLLIIKRLDEFKTFGCPVMIGTSRKSFISMITGIKGDADKRIGGSIASMLLALSRGCNIVRVHDVAETVEAIKISEAIREID
jgi:dihydropteroate synthase